MWNKSAHETHVEEMASGTAIGVDYIDYMSCDTINSIWTVELHYAPL